MYTYARTHIYIYIHTYISIVYFLRSLRLCISELHMYKYIRIYRVSGKKMVQESTRVILLINSFGKKQQIFSYHYYY